MREELRVSDSEKTRGDADVPWLIVAYYVGPVGNSAAGFSAIDVCICIRSYLYLLRCTCVCEYSVVWWMCDEFAEFVTVAMDRKTLLSRERLERAFGMFDSDNSGKISASELATVRTPTLSQIVTEEALSPAVVHTYLLRGFVSEVDMPRNTQQVQEEEPAKQGTDASEDSMGA